jgi:hypothetical protein
LKFGLQIAEPIIHNRSMSKTPKRPRDPNQLAKSIIAIATGEIAPPTAKQIRAKKGGDVGGAARAKILMPEQRSEIARLAASARWKKSD